MSASRSRAPRVARVVAASRASYIYYFVYITIKSRSSSPRASPLASPLDHPSIAPSSALAHFFADDRPNSPVNPLTTIPYVNPAVTAPTRRNAASELVPEYGPPIARVAVPAPRQAVDRRPVAEC